MSSRVREQRPFGLFESRVDFSIGEAIVEAIDPAVVQSMSPVFLVRFHFPGGLISLTVAFCGAGWTRARCL